MKGSILNEYYKEELEAIRNLSDEERAELGRRADMMFKAKEVVIVDNMYIEEGLKPVLPSGHHTV